ncbi:MULTISPECIES: hypothetical protein [unclassified Variovorax]|uniref:hypothetical protein n=1 Tax=unclassified Variovorax TaxID=663243 RepID=UPI0002B6322E|nr:MULTISPECIES: hypothetical protein [unclassified Variovorax]AGF25485.1 hypothetical protein [Variovorax sp. WDL1]KWT98605.1 hypothetical protein APY03_0293 [Variovorax sp. WDL1]PNG50548.1 hypothetical protein CHC06_06172 [Variovorax sp. B2]PNG51417.1 hypothetical protein CHC07_06074 [Variovorax sp. B4]VTU42232.1 hypothetical protein RA8P1_00183 [Variovorax sp. RA8]
MPATRIYIQSEHFPDIKLIEIDSEATLTDLKKAALALMPAGTPTDDLQLSVESDDDGKSAPIDERHARVKDLAKGRGVHIHLHRCKHIEITVRFGNEQVDHKFPPATTIGHVRKWAGLKLGMQPSDIAEHVLQIQGTQTQPDVDTHVGALAKCPNCSLAFDLVPAHRING